MEEPATIAARESPSSAESTLEAASAATNDLRQNLLGFAALHLLN